MSATTPDDNLRLFPDAYCDDAHPAMPAPLSLADVPVGVTVRVVGVRAPAASTEARELALRLLEIGFVEGEPLRVIALGQPGREPIAVRVGGTTFALRRFEAEQVLVSRAAADAPGR